MLTAMAIAAAFCIGIGSFPRLFYSLLPFQVEYQPYSLDHVVGQVQLLFLSALAFTLLMRTGIYPPELRSINLDVDWFYRKPGREIATGVWVLSRSGDGASVASTAASQIRSGSDQCNRTLSWPGWHTCPYPADRRHGVLDGRDVGRVPRPLVLVISHAGSNR